MNIIDKKTRRINFNAMDLDFVIENDDEDIESDENEDFDEKCRKVRLNRGNAKVTKQKV